MTLTTKSFSRSTFYFLFEAKRSIRSVSSLCVSFEKEKAENERGISSALMTQVCEAWLFVLEDTDIPSDDWGYNLGFFERILKKYKGNLNV